MTAGNTVARVDGPEKVTGRARYAVEYQLPGTAYAWPVGSTVAAGTLRSVDVEAALAVPGVVAVLTHDNVVRLDPAGPISPAHGAAVPDLLLLQDREIVFRGQIVAAVIAESAEAAREGASRVEATVDERPASLHLSVGDPGAVVPEMTNDLSPGRTARGDADAELAAAPVQLDLCYDTAAQFAMPMEPHAATATWDGDRLTVYCSDQGPNWTAVTLAGLLGLPETDVEVVADYVGGGFGSKAAPRPPIMLAVLAAKLVGRPVAVALDRPQSAPLATYRSPSRQRVRMGATDDGRITALIHEVTGQTSRLIPYVDQTATMSRTLYDVPHVRTVSSTLPLDVATPGWVRAPGEAPGMFALESAVDELAVHLGIDPVELRARNEPAVDPGTGYPFSSRRLVDCLRHGADAFGWFELSAGPWESAHGRFRHGVGVAAASYPVIIFPSRASASIDAAGTVVVEIAAADIGTGARTVLHQLAAEALDRPMSSIELRMGRSSGPAAPFAGGSMGTGSWGWAVQGACEALTKELATAGGRVPAEGLRVVHDTTADVGALGAYNRHSYGAQFAQVRVDRFTGETRVERLLGVYAAGRIVNPATARSQVVGAMTMGLGMALMEAGETDEVLGGWATQDLASYHVPAHADVGDLDAVFLPERDEHIGSVGGKGVGEIGIVGVAAAITNAVAHATGVRVRSLPATPDKLLPGLLDPAAPRR
ncbi:MULTISPECIES: xanthine dehydrogenase family protein molybdopterin-binding subunit [Pseudonocardia]|uniref:Xanthine dehydrogenase molybdenum-binding subunit n=2 Tax=Pseudonocardia TaxID=1847 RepID=A0A1Y2MKR5_PSEAH|nr:MULTISPECIES: xanthine dehydrogenase family protein molybdopterin-binding subunit [Pseudonocardia]OSY35247.1 Xanthine dehydrogenase molybdenum-binding subunit [Pseudonocardia autotrophica]TDN73152.1 xanthine dehydrogenase molybdenum binding subunit apoprotein [Pseudonocardia autotrophica]BBG03874.1 oxidoreductase [Pseudonocardia autotrophica]GEC29533.1 oxidoreductase [Pseudonocardia saturnea]